jgi:molybdopterin synthase sulfur carrier subunit
MKITLRYFASVREQLAQSQEQVDTSATTLDGLREELIARGEPYAQALGLGKAIRMALNQKVCDGDAALLPDAEVAFFPPVTGG